MTYAFTVDASPKAVELNILSLIGAQFETGITVADVVSILSFYPEASDVHTTLNSDGGDVTEGFAIYSALKMHGAKKTCTILGIAASIASVIAMAHDYIEMPSNAMMMIHHPFKGKTGTAAEFRRAADSLQVMQDAIVSIYMQRFKGSREELIAMMDAETWLSAERCVQLGFADAVTDKVELVAAWDLSSYANVPPALLAAVKPKKEKETASMKLVNKALGLSESADETSALNAIAPLNEAATAHKALCAKLAGKTGFDGRNVGAYLDKLEGDVERLAGEALASNQKAEASARTALIAQGYADQKLTKDLETFYEKKPVAELEAFLKVAPVVVPATNRLKEPKTKQGTGSRPWDTKAFNQLTNLERHQLYTEDKALFHEMRAAK